MKQESIRKNYIYRLLYEILVLITPFITTPYISRVLGADKIGIYSFAVSNVTYFTLIGALGTSSYGAKEIAQHRDNLKEASKLFWEIELMTIITSGLALIGWIIFSSIEKDLRIYYYALIPNILATMFDISWYFTGYEKVKYLVTRNSIIKIFGVILLLVLVKSQEDLILYFVINSTTLLLGNISMWAYLPRMLTKVSFRDLEITRHFKETLVYFIPTVATSVYTVLDKTLIGVITGDNYESGYYEQATRLIKIVKTLVFVSVNAVVGTRISYLFANKKYKEIKNRIANSMDYILFLGIGCVFGIIAVANRFVPVFYGDGYDQVSNLLYYMSPLIIIIGISNCLGTQYYTPSGQRKRSSIVIVVGAVVNLIANLFLIPNYGTKGATVGSILAEGLICILYIQMSDGYITWKELFEVSYKKVIAGSIMLIIIMIIDHYITIRPLLMLIIEIVLGVIVYCIVLLILKDSMLIKIKKVAMRILHR